MTARMVRGSGGRVDKDYTSALVASAVDADTLVFLTDLPSVYLDYGDDGERAVEEATAGEMQRYLEAGEFGEASMKPKVETAVEFVRETGGEAALAEASELAAALKESAGTRIL